MSLSTIVEFAKSKLGCGYVYGATGWVCSEARRRQQAEQYPQYADLILNTCAKWDGKQCFDCAQLTRYAVKAAGGNLPSGATSQWNTGPWVRKGAIADMPEKPGLILYRAENGKMPHTGIYAGNGEFIDARGSAYGVIRSPMSSYKWTHWAEPDVPENGNAAINTNDVKDASAIYDAYTVKASGGLRMRETPGGTYMRMVPDGTTVYVMRIEQGAGLIEYAGHMGYVSMQYLVPVSEGAVTAPATPAENVPAPVLPDPLAQASDTITVKREALLEIFALVGAMLSGGVD